MEAVDWRDHIPSFQVSSPQFDGCSLSPDGSQMACTSLRDGGTIVFTSGGIETIANPTYLPLGWIDDEHLVVGATAALGIVDVRSGDFTFFDVFADGNRARSALIRWARLPHQCRRAPDVHTDQPVADNAVQSKGRSPQPSGCRSPI
jgi:hypothetical protein